MISVQANFRTFKESGEAPCVEVLWLELSIRSNQLTTRHSVFDQN
jgi:hypothetical protein